MSATSGVLDEIGAEREAQEEKWGEQNHRSFSPHRDITQRQGLREMFRRICNDAAKAGTVTWAHILDEEIAEANAEADPVQVRAEFVQAAAVIVAWIESIDRNEIP